MRFWFVVFVTVWRLGFAQAQMAAMPSKEFRPENFVPLCETVFIHKGYNIRFTEIERRLLCGDPRPDAVGAPWAEVPPNQARYFIRGFLQSRGFLNPEFVILKGRLYVTPGPTQTLTDFQVVGAPEKWRPPRLRFVLGQTLRPALLDELEAWTKEEMQDLGYACAETHALADPDTGLARVETEIGERKRILDVVDESETDLYPTVLDRYNAFRIGEYYSQSLVRLTRKRILEDGLMQAVAFNHQCYPNGVIIRRDPVLGPPREARVGFGGSTETGLRVRGALRQLRLSELASNVELNADVSYRRQEANLLGRFYYSRSDTSNFFEPTVQYVRRNETTFESQELTASVFHNWVEEFNRGRSGIRLGPTWLYSLQERGQGPSETTLVYMEGGFRWLSHETELFETSPRGGQGLQAEVLHAQKDLGSEFTATRMYAYGHMLWSFGKFDPPLYIFGIRFNIGTTLTQDDLAPTDLPIRFRFFSGGTEDLRGFARQSLPVQGTGGLTEVTVSAEGRIHRVLFRDRVDPFMFVDVGKVGLQSLRLDPAIYLSPGLGLRWESPVGVFRGYVARGATVDEPAGLVFDDRWRFGFTFGEEF